MSLVCPANHRWDAPGHAESASRCPVCGAAALASSMDTTPPSTGNGAPEPATGPYVPGGDTPTAMLSPPGLVAAAVAAGYPEVPGYTIEGILGRGGMGVVYRAQQRSLNRTVALKMMLAGAEAAGTEDLERFRAEAEAFARLTHPNIVNVYEVGAHQGVPYFSLEFVDGGSLDRRLRGVPQPPGAAAQLAETLARAMHAAHQRGIVHRDLKPANVLLATDGTPKITDFGLAKRLDADSSRTRAGTVMGTPSYMAPEQAEGRTDEVGFLADVYALGAILYEMLTGRPPFRGSTALDTVYQVVHEEPVPPSRLQPTVPRDLETVCLKCLEKDPRKRYATAFELAEDLRRFQAGEPTRARPVGPVGRLHKWARRNPMVASLATLAIVLFIAGLSGVTWQLHETSQALEREKDARNDAQDKKIEAEKARESERTKAEDFRLLLYDSQMDRAYQAWEQSRVNQVRQILDGLRPTSDQADLRRAEWFCLWEMTQRQRRIFRGHRGAVVATVFSPDGRWVASGGTDSTVRLWSPETGEGRRLITGGPKRGSFALAFSADSRTLAVGGGPGQDTGPGYVSLHDVDTGEVRAEFAHPATVYGLAFEPKGDALASACFDGVVRLYDTQSNKLRHELKGHKAGALSIAFSPNGVLVASGSWDHTARLWNAKDGSPGLVLKPTGAYPVQAIAFSADGTQVASGGPWRSIDYWDVKTGRVVRAPDLSEWSSVNGLAFASTGRMLAVALSDGHRGVIALLPSDRRGSRLLRGHLGAVTTVGLSPDGQNLVSGGDDGTVRVWSVREPSQVQPPVLSLAFQPQGKLLALARGRGVRVIDMAQQKLRANYTHEFMVFGVAVSPDGRWLASAEGPVPTEDQPTGAGFIVVRGLEDGKERFVLRGHAGGVFAVAFSPDGRYLASGGWDQSIKLWNMETGKEAKSLAGFGQIIRTLAFAPDGRRLAAGGGDRWRSVPSHVRIWDIESGALTTSLRHKDPVRVVAFTPDGKDLVTGGLEYDVSVWDVAAKQRRFVLEGHINAVVGLSFTPDRERLASAGQDGRVCLWNLKTGQRGGRINTLNGAWSVAFSPDGRLLAVGGQDEGSVSDVTFWPTAPFPGDAAPAP